MIAQINDNREVYCDTSFLCNEHENDASKIIVNLPKSLVSDDYFYYIVCKSPDNVVPEFAVPLLLKNGNELIYLIGSNIGSISGRWEFCIVVKSVELDESGDIGTNGLIAITDTFHGNVESGIINEGELGEQPMDPNLQLLYDELLALTAAIRPHLHDIAQLAEELKAYRDDAEDFKNDAQFSAATAQNAKDEAVNLLIVIQGISNDLDALVVQINSLVTGFNVSKLDFDTKYADVLSKYNDFSTKYTDFLSKYNTIDDDVAAVAADKVTVQGILTTVQGIKTNIDQVKNDIELTKSSIDTIYADIIENYGGLANKIDKSQIVNDLVTGGADDVASAETVKILNGDKLPNSHNADVEAHPDIREQYGTIQTQTILENYLSSHNIPSTAKRGKLDVELKGMTNVNLFGTDGNCEDIGKFKTGYGTPTLSLDTVNKVYGSNALKIATTVVGHGTGLSFRAQANKYYMLSMYYKVTSGILQHSVYDESNKVAISGGINISSANMVRIVRKLAVTANSADVRWLWKQQETSAMTAYIDGVMVNEISADEYNDLSVDELMAKYPYHDGLQGASNIQVLSTGKNLVYNGNGEYGINGWSISSGCSLSIENGMFKVSTTGTSKAIYKEIRVKPNTDYYISCESMAGTGSGYLQILDLNGANIRAGSGTFNSGNNNRIQLAVTMIAVGFIYYYKIQLEEGTTSTPYEPYRGTEITYKTLDGQSVTLHRLPNGVYDKKQVDGRYLKRIGEKTLVASDVVNLISGTNVQLVQFKKPLDFKYSGIASGGLINDKCFMYPPYEAYNFDDYDNINNLNKISHRTSAGNMSLAVALATYPNLAAAQSALAGTKFLYELAQPQILETNAVPLIAEPNGHVFISSDSCMPENEISYPLNLGAVVDGMLNGQKELGNLIKNYSQKLEPKQWMPVNWKNDSALPSSYTFGTTYFNANNFGGFSDCIVYTEYFNQYLGIQKIISMGVGHVVKQRKVSNNTWTEWVDILTSQKIKITSLPFASGVVDFTGFGQRTRYIKDSNGKVTINCYCQFSNTNKITFGGGLLIATMPIGFRTNMAISDSGSVILYGDAAVTATIPVTITILPNGDIYMGAFDYTGTNHILMFTLVYYSEV